MALDTEEMMKTTVMTSGFAVLAACLLLAATPVGAASSQISPPLSGGGANPHVVSYLPLCDGTWAQHVTRLEVERSRPSNPERFSFPSVIASTRFLRIRALVKVVCSLPKAPKGIEYCSLDWGVNYTLTFVQLFGGTGGAITSEPVHYDASGCARVTGAGGLIARESTGTFRAALGSALGLTHVTSSTFVGTLTSG